MAPTVVRIVLPSSVKEMRSVLLTCLLSLAAVNVAGAQQPADSGDPGDASDPPGRVARLSYTDGSVSMAAAGTEEWADAVINRPLTSGDRVWVDNGAHAELQAGSASIYLDQGSGFSFVDLDDNQIHMNLTDGAVVVRIRRQRDDEHIQVDTPNTTVSLLRPGEYHIQVVDGGATTVVQTRTGESEVAGEHNTYHIPANEEGVFKGTDQVTADINAIPARNGFETWANERESRAERSQSAQYVSNEVIGYEDLDSNGDWVSEPEYGYVWQPRTVVVGWAPYRYGRWAWVAPWGWSWIDDSPWGFAPFHYGRWAYARDRWCWVPGPRNVRAVYAPALVGWVGNPGVGVSVSIGSGVGWFPLGPREVFVPGYRHSPRYIRNVNVSNTIIVNNTYVTNIYNGRGSPRDYRYGRATNAVTVVQRDQFIGGRSIGGHFSNVSQAELRGFRQDARPPAVVPDRNSVLASRIAARQPPARDVRFNEDRRTPNRTQPARVSFDAERRAIEANNGRPVSREQLFRANNDPRDVTTPPRGKDPAGANRSGPIKQGAVQEQPAQSGAAPNVGSNRDNHGVGSNRDNSNQPGATSMRNRDAQTNDNARDQSPNQAGSRQLNDRPDWARSRRDNGSQNVQPGSVQPQNPAGQQASPRDTQSPNDSKRIERQPYNLNHNGNQGNQQSGAGSAVPARPPTESGAHESVQPSQSQSEAQSQTQRLRREAQQADRADRVVSPREYSHPPRTESRPAERAPAPQVSAPREQPHVERAPPPARVEHAPPPVQRQEARPQPQAQPQSQPSARPSSRSNDNNNSQPRADQPKSGGGNKWSRGEQKH